MKIVGDNKQAIGNGYSYEKSLSKDEVVEMVRLLCAEFSWQVPKIEFPKRKTRRKLGSYNNLTHLLRLYRLTEGLILHELAHRVTRLHNKRFKDLQVKLYLAWYGTATSAGKT